MTARLNPDSPDRPPGRPAREWLPVVLVVLALLVFAAILATPAPDPCRVVAEGRPVECLPAPCSAPDCPR